MRRALLALMLLWAKTLSAQTVEDQMREMRAEIQRLREELDQVKQELHSHDQVLEDAPVMQAQIKEQAQTKVETTAKFPMKVFGTIVSNTFWNSGQPNWWDIPNIAQPDVPGVRPGAFGFSLRQTRIGATLEGPSVGGMKLNGTVAMDFYGGIPSFETGEVIPLPRLVYAYARLDGEKTAFEIGQDYMMFSPKNPTSLMGTAFPTLYRSGNLYLRAPQLRAERLLASNGSSQVRVVGGILEPVAGDFGAPGDAYDFEPPALAGNRSQMPFFQSRQSWRATPEGPYEQPQWELGVSENYGRERFTTGTQPSWGASADLDATKGKLGVGAEYFVGRNIAGFGGSIAQLFAKSQGGFVEGRFAPTRRLSFNAGYGTDQLFDLVKFPAPLSRNRTFFANTIFNFTPEFRAAFEYQHLATKPIDSSVLTNNHVNLTFAYSF